MKAIWLPIEGYEDLYEVSNTGKVRSLCGRYGKNRILKQSSGSKGYLIVTLCGKGPQKTVNVHRLVAKAFIPNPDNLPCVNHIDEDRTNNNVTNLEWCSYYHNNTYGHRLTKSAEKLSHPVRCIETGEVFPSAYAAQRETGIRQANIWKVCHGERHTAGGYHWELI